MSETAACAHRKVSYKPEMGDKFVRDRWLCDICGIEFVQGSRLEALRITHPTDVCECRFDFGDYKEGEPPKMRHTCKYHAGILERLNEWQDVARQKQEIIDTEHQQTEHQRQRAIDAESRLDQTRELLKNDEVGEWKELMDLVNGPVVATRCRLCGNPCDRDLPCAPGSFVVWTCEACLVVERQTP